MIMITATDDIRCKVKVESFEGPLDLLLYLIQKDEIDIYDIPISYITKQYIEYLNFMKELDLEIAGEYLYIASVLVNIKARMLLPRPVKEDGLVEDPREELTAALIEYRQFKNAGEYLRLKLRSEILYTPRGRVILPKSVPEIITVPLDLFDLMRTAWEILKRHQRVAAAGRRTKIDIAERIEFVRQKVEQRQRLTLLELFEQPKITGLFFVGTFFAILELMRQKFLLIRQQKPFGNIWIYKRVNR